VDQELELGLRRWRASPEDDTLLPRLVAGLLRADRADAARGLLAPAERALREASDWSELGRATSTVDRPPALRPALLEAGVRILSRCAGLDSEAGDRSLVEASLVAFYEAASRLGSGALDPGLFGLALDAAGADPALRARVYAASLRRLDAELASRLFAVAGPKEPLGVRLALASAARRFEGSSPALCLAGTRRLSMAPPSLAAEVPCPLQPGPAGPPMERQPGRTFGAHGADYEFGPVLCLNTRLDHRLLMLDFELWSALRDELSDLCAALALPPFDSVVFASGYGFAWADELAPGEDKAVQLARLLNAWGCYPGVFEYGGRRPYDVLRDDGILVRRYRRDLENHQARYPARSGERPFWSSPAMDLLARVGPSRKGAPPDCSDLLEAARDVYCSVGLEALESFYERLQRPLRGFIPGLSRAPIPTAGSDSGSPPVAPPE
jgi:hypothetical protein